MPLISTHKYEPLEFNSIKPLNPYVYSYLNIRNIDIMYFLYPIQVTKNLRKN